MGNKNTAIKVLCKQIEVYLLNALIDTELHCLWRKNFCSPSAHLWFILWSFGSKATCTTLPRDSRCRLSTWRKLHYMRCTMRPISKLSIVERNSVVIDETDLTFISTPTCVVIMFNCIKTGIVSCRPKQWWRMDNIRMHRTLDVMGNIVGRGNGSSDYHNFSSLSLSLNHIRRHFESFNHHQS